MELFRNETGYVPLLVNFEGYWDVPFDDLPAHLKPLAQEQFSPWRWDDLDARQRRSAAAQLDYRQNPEYEPGLYFRLICFQDDLGNWIEAARQAGKDAAVVALRDVVDSVQRIIDTDRGRAGVEIQRLRATVAASADSLQAMQVGGEALKVRLAEVESERDALRAMVEKMGAAVEPSAPSDRAYISNRLAFSNQAARHWWANADPHDPSTHPNNADVAAWLIRHGFSPSLADKAASVIRPEWAHAGRKPEE